MSEKLVEVTKGATRSEIAPAWHLVPPAGPRRVAIRYGLGAEVHGAWNWQNAAANEQSARAWCEQVYDHMIEHMAKMVSGVDPEDDHLGAIGWAVTQLCWFEDRFGCRWTHIGWRGKEKAPSSEPSTPVVVLTEWVEKGGPMTLAHYSKAVLREVHAELMVAKTIYSKEQLHRIQSIKNYYSEGRG